jgi:hypothetical protein
MEQATAYLHWVHLIAALPTVRDRPRAKQAGTGEVFKQLLGPQAVINYIASDVGARWLAIAS